MTDAWQETARKPMPAVWRRDAMANIRKYAWRLVASAMTCGAIALAACANPQADDSTESVQEELMPIAEVVTEEATAEEKPASETESEAYGEEAAFSGQTTKIAPELIENNGDWPEYFRRFLNKEAPNHPGESLAVVKSVSFPDNYLPGQIGTEWVYAHFFPAFTELDAPGAEIIRDHYLEEYERSKLEAEYFFADEFFEYEFMYGQHSYMDWNSYIVGNYLVVAWEDDLYGGGAHGYYAYWADHFDLRTGEYLTFEDVFMDYAVAAPVLGHLITVRLVEECDWYVYGYDDKPRSYEQYIKEGHADLNFAEGDRFLRSGTVPTFRLESDGITFIFNPYEIGSFACGAFFPKVPYEQMRDILRIDISTLF